MYYSYSTCMYYSYSTCMHYSYSTCMHYSYCTCMYYSYLKGFALPPTLQIFIRFFSLEAGGHGAGIRLFGGCER